MTSKHLVQIRLYLHFLPLELCPWHASSQDCIDLLHSLLIRHFAPCLLLYVMVLLLTCHRLFAVGYATRQLSGLPAHASPAALREHLLQQNAAATALHSQMLLVAAHSARLKEALVRPDADLAAEMAAGTGLWGDVAAAVSMTDTLVTGLPQLLAAASGPRDLLIPPGQQRLRPSAGTGVQSTQTSGCLATIHYLKHCPDSTQPATCPLQQQQRLQEDALQQVLSSPNAARYCLLPEAAARRSDVSDLTLQSPVPLEALADPEVWWRWQQALLQLHACDVCGAETTEDEVSASAGVV